MFKIYRKIFLSLHIVKEHQSASNEGLQEESGCLQCLRGGHAVPQFFLYTVEPRFNDLQFNDILGITINICFPRKSYSNIYGAERQFNNLRFNDIPGLMIGILFPEFCKTFPGITIKSI